MPDTPTTGEVLEELLDDAVRDVRVALPGRIQRVKDGGALLDVEVMVDLPLVAQDGSVINEPLGVIADVPFAFPVFGAFRLTWPLEKGDAVTLLCHDVDMGQWLTKGVRTAPGDIRYHTLSGAVAQPTAVPDSKAVSISSAGMQLGHRDNLLTLTQSAAEVGGASDAAALASRVKTLETAFTTHTHAVTGGPTGVPVNVPPYVPQVFDSQRLKVGS